MGGVRNRDWVTTELIFAHGVWQVETKRLTSAIKIVMTHVRRVKLFTLENLFRFGRHCVEVKLSEMVVMDSWGPFGV